ncbi:MAG: gluconokinase [Vallitaleaceae bacterium]|nr:gluconokinase [Vallitaleaceae bacterium]
MKAQNYFIGIDVGTSSVRAVLFDNDGYQITMESQECVLISTIEGHFELSPEAVFTATLQVLKGCIENSKVPKTAIAGMGFSCHMHSLMAVDVAGNPLTELMIWADARAQAEANWINLNFNGFELYKKTGCRVSHPLYPISKLLWLKKNKPAVFKQAAKFITIKEYIIHKLYGEYLVDVTLASCQGYFNLHIGKWDQTILSDILGITSDRLSSVVACTTVLKNLKKEFADFLGLGHTVPMVIGSGDGIMANLGCGVLDSNAVSSTIGTSGAIRTTTAQPLFDPEQRTWCYAFTQNQWVIGGALNNGGLVLKWLRETFKQQFEYDAGILGEKAYKVFDHFAGQVPPGSEGLIFLPYLIGERSPDWRCDVRGLMVGLDYNHSRKHIIRAAMEGVMYRMFSIYEAMEQSSHPTAPIKANGGYTASEVWLQIQSDVFNKEIQISAVSEASALGAAYLAMIALGFWTDQKELPSMKAIKSIQPCATSHAIYRNTYERSKEIYKSIYPPLGGIE